MLRRSIPYTQTSRSPHKYIFGIIPRKIDRLNTLWNTTSSGSWHQQIANVLTCPLQTCVVWWPSGWTGPPIAIYVQIFTKFVLTLPTERERQRQRQRERERERERERCHNRPVQISGRHCVVVVSILHCQSPAFIIYQCNLTSSAWLITRHQGNTHHITSQVLIQLTCWSERGAVNSTLALVPGFTRSSSVVSFSSSLAVSLSVTLTPSLTPLSSGRVATSA